MPIVANNGNGNPLKIISQAVDSVLKKHKKKNSGLKVLKMRDIDVRGKVYIYISRWV